VTLRHPLRGLFGGLLLGIGLALVLVQLSVAPLGTNTVLIVIALCTVLGLILAYALPARPVR
jgi:hypothetical protein